MPAQPTAFATPPALLHAGRLNGLDTLRAAAILLVFMYHYMVFVSGEPTFGWLSVIGWTGVDLFFVLSGYLIGNQILAGLVRGQALSIGAFYARRGLRTWPAFWVVLAAYAAFPLALSGGTMPPLWRFLTFTQNLGLQPGTAFSHAWSLCIEEQFYLVLPVALLLALRLGWNRRHGWLILATGVLAGVLIRAWLWSRYGTGEAARGYTSHIYYSTLCRFDEFLPGLAIALLRNGHPRVWTRLMAHGHALLLGGSAAVTAILFGAYRYYQIPDHGYGAFMTIAGYSLIAMGYGLLVLAALCPTTILARVRIPGAYHLARWSYSIYLTHKGIGHLVREYAQTSGMGAGAELALCMVLSVTVGVVLFRLVESPFMTIRQRLFPTNFTAPGVQAAAVTT